MRVLNAVLTSRQEGGCLARQERSSQALLLWATGGLVSLQHKSSLITLQPSGRQ